MMLPAEAYFQLLCFLMEEIETWYDDAKAYEWHEGDGDKTEQKQLLIGAGHANTTINNVKTRFARISERIVVD